MNRTLIKDLKPNTTVTISGWLENLRDKRAMQFLVIKDITGSVQVTVEKEKLPELAEKISATTLSSVVTVTGTVVENSYVKLNGMEIIPTDYKVESLADALPINAQSNIDQRHEYRWIDLRSDKNILTFKVATAFEHALREYMQTINAIEIHTPKITAQSSEGGSDVFKLDYFGTPAYLTQSPQFYKQMAMASGFEKAYEVADYFRAEKSFTARHATNFVGFDFEMSYISSHLDVMREQENMLRYALTKVKEQYGEQIKALFDVEIELPEKPFPIITLKEGLQILKTKYNYELEDDLDPQGETYLGEWAKETFNSDFLFVTEYFFKNRAFYTMKCEHDKEVSKSYDLLWKGQEITSGAQREHRADVLTSQIAEKGINPENMKGYIQFFEYGCPPHGGFGMGLARVVAKMLNIATIKDTSFVFRGPTKLHP